VVARNAKVSQQGVDTLYFVVAHPVVEKTEIAPYERKALFVFGDILLGVSVLVETVKVSFRREVFQDFFAVSAATECHIDIRSVGAYIHAFDTCFEQYGHMVAV
jgi:hypothetical protein